MCKRLHVDLSQIPSGRLYRGEPRSTTAEAALCIVCRKRTESQSLLPSTCQSILSFTIGCVNSARGLAPPSSLSSRWSTSILPTGPRRARCIVNDNRCIRLYGGWLVNPFRPTLSHYSIPTMLPLPSTSSSPYYSAPETTRL